MSCDLKLASVGTIIEALLLLLPLLFLSFCLCCSELKLLERFFFILKTAFLTKSGLKSKINECCDSFFLSFFSFLPNFWRRNFDVEVGCGLWQLSSTTTHSHTRTLTRAHSHTLTHSLSRAYSRTLAVPRQRAQKNLSWFTAGSQIEPPSLPSTVGSSQLAGQDGWNLRDPRWPHRPRLRPLHLASPPSR